MAFKMKGSPIKLGSIATKSALKQYVENVEEGQGLVSLDGTDYLKAPGKKIIPYSEEAKAAHDANIRRLSKIEGLSIDDYNAEVAKTRHLPNPNPVVDEEPTVYPKNPKDEKTRKRRKGIQIDFRKTKDARKGLGGRIGYKLIPKITRGGRGITFNQ